MARRHASTWTSTKVLWTTWVTSTVLTVIYAIFGAFTYSNLLKVSEHFPQGQYQRILNGVRTAAAMGPILVTGLTVVSLVILLYKTWKPDEHPGFSYGWLDSAYLHQGLFLMLASSVLRADRDLLGDFSEIQIWSHVDSLVYHATYAIGYVACVTYVLLFLLLLLFPSVIARKRDRARYLGDEEEPFAPGSEAGTPRSRPPTPSR